MRHIMGLHMGVLLGAPFWRLTCECKGLCAREGRDQEVHAVLGVRLDVRHIVGLHMRVLLGAQPPHSA